ncbi:reductive dehalogenase [Dehalogenimonas formicexedens]|uniref:Reductive dehalogenase n=1 Tax=Dehalogenimonas formicexedens TaxID=1839801 RepID=A0A1P8F5L9_9CHLR|nr:reductive dehalogenase [Dehalogenimonas formicexedens]APV43728.1 reductive dehalogenase [Dehalogenimonas formicexedens]
MTTGFHSTVTRRTFMKGLGLVATGSAALTSPVFHDLDELVSSSSSGWHRPWYIKEREFENPVLPIDWANQQRAPAWRISPFRYQSSTDPKAANVRDNGLKIATDWIKEKYPDWGKGQEIGFSGLKPGTVRDLALANAVGTISFYDFPGKANKTWYLGLQAAATPETLKIAKWQGTPEENIRMLRAAARFFGAQDLGVTGLTANTKKFVFEEETDKKKWIFGGSEPKETATERYIPDAAQWVISYTNIQSTELTPRQPSALGATATTNAYRHWPQIEVMLKEFLRGLGYYGLSGTSFSAVGPSNPWGLMSGIGEQQRMANVLISPEWGAHVRALSRMPTNLPLAPTPPIDFGAYKFCSTCKICAETCPYGSLSMGGPTSTPPVDQLGAEQAAARSDQAYTGWWVDYRTCAFCGACQGVCPFNSTKDAPIHDIVISTVANTPLFNGFFASMERNFNYGFKDPETWWDMDLPVYGVSPKFTGKVF